MDRYGYPEPEEVTTSYENHYSSHTYSYTSSENRHSSSSHRISSDDSNDPTFTEQDYAHPNPNYPQPPESKHNPGPEPVPYGGMVSHQDDNNDDDKEDGKFYLHVDPTVDQDELSDFELSNCQGKKRALLIGINYVGTKNELNGCINDVQNIKNFLTSLYGFQEEDMVILTDNQENPKFKPTRANILAAMQWLVHDAEPNDSFFFHYSGHGGRVEDAHADEDDGFDETIYPLDFEQFEGTSGQIRDDDMHNIMVRPLPKGCRLTAIFDSCHSGTVLDLPYVYSTRGEIKQTNLFKHAGMGLLSAGVLYAKGDKDGALSSIMSLGKQLLEARMISSEARKRNTTLADVIMFSGCKDDQTSADAQEAGRATGAMSYALTTTLRQNPNQSYHQLLNNLRQILRDKYSQRPQMSSSHPIDVNLEFTC
ncbi:Ca(2+)-dependent cysteine protease [Rhizopus azygosporus]|uniref:Ca(2+)-dependent cysteine protease n=1 Tax=Rhizopus azygosporus TaxID=86630 RepID=A0A367J0S9_RHIAZ|nr:Ca(2+)-dependent cysteine protease [Rhizopus azygosporus]